MSFACQKDSYRKEFTSVVRSCEPASLSTLVSGKKQKLSGFEVILDDTILFPEGGGQPDDRGTISSVPVLRVTRRGAEAVHFLPTPLDPGSEVKVEVDWARRWDNMQQHSGQHLITAIADGEYGYPTTSWSLGEKTSFIELDTAAVTSDQLRDLEVKVNESIRSGVKMYPTLYSGIDDPRLSEVRTRGLPEDHVGAVRVVTIEGIENNMCCGTHVSNLGHLQAIKLLAAEKGKKGRTNLVFVAGDRVLRYLGETYTREKQITGLVKGNPEQHVDLIDKVQKSQKVASKTAVTLLREMALMEARLYKTDTQREPLLSIHRKEGDNEYTNILVNEIADEIVLVFVTTGDEKGQGLFMLAGREDEVAALGPKVAEIIEARGAGKKGRFQGKANKLSKRGEAEKLLREHIATRTS